MMIKCKAITGIVFSAVFLAACSDQDRDNTPTAAKEYFGDRIELRDVQPMAEAGDAAAQYALGMMYSVGDGVDVDEALALEWMRRSADQGYAPAQYQLGSYYTLERAGPDFVRAAKWLRLASEQGHVSAQTSIGMLYGAGRGVEQDFAEALAWLTLASESGDALAKERKQEVLKVITDEEFSRGLKLAQRYRAMLHTNQ